MLRIAGFDCANKSLGVCHISFDTDAFTKHREVVSRLSRIVQSIKKSSDRSKIENLREVLGDLLDIYSLISVDYIDVLDLIPGKKVGETTRMDRLTGLKRELRKLNDKFTPHLVLIENQITDKARSICDGIIYHYSCGVYETLPSVLGGLIRADEVLKYLKPPAIKIVMPGIKNTVAFSKDSGYEQYIKKYSSNYQVNKAHSRENLKIWARVYDLDISHMPNKNLDDAGDAFMMIVGFLSRLGR